MAADSGGPDMQPTAPLSESLRASPAGTPPSFVAGDRLADRYRIVSLLGRGGMGEVYEAWDEQLSIPIALKTLRLDISGDPQALRRLKREVLLARSVAHPHVCRVYDLGWHGEEQNTEWFLTMELLQGVSLRQLLAQRGRMTEEAALPLLVQITAGLGAAHRAGVVHRDFKSDNVMIVTGPDEERAVVTDFGLAQSLGKVIGTDDSTLTGSGFAVGTLAYMAPEQLRGEDVGPAADVHALGVVIYEMMTGTLPFAGGMRLLAAVRGLPQQTPSPRSVVPELDERWEAVVLRCLSVDPAARFARVEEVAEALAGRLPVTLTRPGIAAQGQRTLPAERDHFVGREADLGEIERHLTEGAHLLTLLGAGGMGKTRLAVRYAWRRLDQWPGGVWFSDLTEARSINGIASAVAGSLGVPLGRGDPVEQLGHAIAGRGKCLVILDNFEQVVTYASETLGRWMERAEEARFVVTSRERLNLRGEQVRVLEPLPPESGIELFLERARRQHPGLELEESQRVSVLEVVRLVEGMPLAIELAAARIRVMTAAQIVERMRERFRLLAARSGGRHATLRATIDGSWELLRPWEQSALAQCVVFEGGFTLEAAEAVLDLEAWEEAPWVVDVLQSLVDKSLLRTWIPKGLPGSRVPDARFGMYVSLQEYARERLERDDGGAAGRGNVGGGSPGSGGVGRGGDGSAAALHASPGSGARSGSGSGSARDLPDVFRTDLARRSSGEAASDIPDIHDGDVSRRSGGGSTHDVRNTPEGGTGNRSGRGAGAMRGAEERHGRWFARFGTEERIEALDRRGGAEQRQALQCDLENLVAACRRSARWGLAGTAVAAYRAAWAVLDLRGPLGLGLELGRELLGAPPLSDDDRARAQWTLGHAAWRSGRTEEAFEHLNAALAVFREAGHRRSEGAVLAILGSLRFQQGRIEEARALYESALAIHQEVGDRLRAGIVLGNLGTLHLEQGRMREALAFYEEALAIHREVGNRRSEGIALGNLGSVHLQQGCIEEAHALLDQALSTHRAVGDQRTEGIVLGILGSLHLGQGRVEEARALLEAALSIHRAVGDRRLEGIELGNLGCLYLDKGAIEEAAPLLAAALDMDREVGNRRAEGAVLGALGTLHFRQGRIEEARENLLRGKNLLKEVGDRIELGKLLCVLGTVEHRAGQESLARDLMTEAETLAREAGAGPDSELGSALEGLRRAL